MSTPPPSVSAPITNDDNLLQTILSQLSSIRTENEDAKKANQNLVKINHDLMKVNQDLRKDIKGLRKDNQDLKKDNEALKDELEKQRDLLQTTMEAVVGDRAAINKIRRRVLLDKGRDMLAFICGYDNWKVWKAQSASKENMFSLASARLRVVNQRVTPSWMAVARQPSALGKLLYPNRIRELGDSAAHNSTPQDIAEGVLSLVGEQERKDMSLIFEAVYNMKPEAQLD